MTTLISRRIFLQRAPIAAVAIGAPASALAVEAHSAPVETSEERIVRLVQDLIEAVTQSENWSDWADWHPILDPKAGIVQIIAQRKAEVFTGPGHYVVAIDRNLHEVYRIERDPAKDDAKMGRCFRMKPRDTSEKPFWMFDDHLQSMLIKKIGGVA